MHTQKSTPDSTSMGDQHEASLYRLLVRDLKDYAIFQIGLDHRITSWNAGVQRNLGYTEEEFLGMPFTHIFLDEDVAAGIPEQELKCAEECGETADERWHKRKGGSRIFVHGRVAALHIRGRLIGFSKVLRDETQRKLLQQALERSNEELEEFAATVSHDLRTPLRTIQSFTQLLARHLAPRLDVEAQGFLANILNGAEAMRNLVDSLLEYARAGHEPIARERIDVSELVYSVWTGFQRLAEQKAANVRFEGKQVIESNPTQLRQVFQNLFENALKYAGTQPLHIDVRVLAQQNDCLVSVKDNGAGFDPKYAEQIFDPLKRLGHASEGGVGLGLAICKRIVHRLGGKIWAESQPGQGATFYFTLPDC